MATSPCHSTFTTVTRVSGRMPLIVAPLVSCSSRAIAHAGSFLNRFYLMYAHCTISLQYAGNVWYAFQLHTLALHQEPCDLSSLSWPKDRGYHRIERRQASPAC